MSHDHDHNHRCTQSDFVFSTIYGDEEAQKTIFWLQALREAMPLPALDAEHRFSAGDLFLMANPTDFLGSAPTALAGLRQFADRWLKGWVSGLHLLPFYPAEENDPHATQDFRRVRSELGNWSDILALGGQFHLMTDLPLQRTARAHHWFQAFCQGDPDFEAYYLGHENPTLNYLNPQILREMSAALLHTVYRGARLARLVDVERLWFRDGSLKLNDTRSHLAARFLRSVVNECAPGFRLMAGVSGDQGDTALYGGNGENEANLLPNNAFAPLLLHALWNGDTVPFCTWAKRMSLPFPEVMFYNQIDTLESIAVLPAARVLSAEQRRALGQQTEARGGQVTWQSGADGQPDALELRLRLWDALRAVDGETEDTGIARYLAAHAVLFSLVGLPALSLSSLLAPALPARISGEGRIAVSQAVDLSALESQMAQENSPLRRVFDGLRQLAAARAAVPAFDPAGVQTILDAGEGVFGVLRFSLFEVGLVVCLTNFTNQTRGACADINEEGFEVSAWRDVLSDQTFSNAQARQLSLQPYQSLWLVPVEA